jgi:hypothetical protein
VVHEEVRAKNNLQPFQKEMEAMPTAGLTTRFFLFVHQAGRTRSSGVFIMNRKDRVRFKRLINVEGEKDPTSYDLFMTELRERAAADRRAIAYGQRRLEESGDVDEDDGGIWRHEDGTFATRYLITLMEGNPFVAAIEARIFEKKEGGLASRIEKLLREQFG